MPDLTKLHFAGLLANQTRHAEGLAAILSAFFTMPVQVECFVGAWLTLQPSRPDAAGRNGRRRARSAARPCWAAGSGAGSTNSASCSGR